MEAGALVFIRFARSIVPPTPPEDGMKKHKLHTDALKVESFSLITEPDDPRGTSPDPANCICFAPPCICTNNVDCTQSQ
jgi:hypothetical protein